MLGDVANAKGIELLAHCAPDLPAGVRGDPTRLRQILVNLTSNAVKFTQEGEVVIRAAADGPTEQRDGADLMRVRFEVRDTGIGMSETAKQFIFDPFSQADASTTRRFGGTGLGLAIVKQLVELMGGEVGRREQARSRQHVLVRRPARALSPRRRPSCPSRTLAGLHALVVDDNATNRLILTEQLRSWGMRAEEADDGPTAIVRARSVAVRGDAFDVVVLDLNMPEMDGLEVARVLREDPSTAGARLFLLSSSGRVKADVATAAGLCWFAHRSRSASPTLYNCLVDGFAAEVDDSSPPAATERSRLRRVRPSMASGARCCSSRTTRRTVSWLRASSRSSDTQSRWPRTGREALEMRH